jgi:hypothetical protein
VFAPQPVSAAATVEYISSLSAADALTIDAVQVPFAACGSAPESYTSAQCSSQDHASLSTSVVPVFLSIGSNPSDHFSVLISTILQHTCSSASTDTRHNAALQCLHFLLRILNVLGSSLSPKTGYTSKCLSWLYSGPSADCGASSNATAVSCSSFFPDVHFT